MGDVTKIEWADKTFNPWIGCQKVSPGCDHCYAESLAKRYGWVEWGPRAERKRTSEANWKKPRQWAKAARGSGKRPRVFCASLADVFDNQVPTEWRTDLFNLIAATLELDWLLLTKRPENLAKMFPTGLWPNVWLGTTCEDQERYDRRWPLLLEIPAEVRFISYEPAIGPLRLHSEDEQPDWLICGGESGHGARFMEPAWAERIRNDCRAEGVPFFMKQLGSKSSLAGVTGKGDNPLQWPENLRVREFPR